MELLSVDCRQKDRIAASVLLILCSLSCPTAIPSKSPLEDSWLPFDRTHSELYIKQPPRTPTTNHRTNIGNRTFVDVITRILQLLICEISICHVFSTLHTPESSSSSS